MPIFPDYKAEVSAQRGAFSRVGKIPTDAGVICMPCFTAKIHGEHNFEVRVFLPMIPNGLLIPWPLNLTHNLGFNQQKMFSPMLLTASVIVTVFMLYMEGKVIPFCNITLLYFRKNNY